MARGIPNDKFRCSLCDKLEQEKNEKYVAINKEIDIGICKKCNDIVTLWERLKKSK